MQRRYQTVDVFTDRPFGGNPLGIVLDAEGLTTAQMQAVAAEFNYAETTFVFSPCAAEHAARVRIFTPRIEVPFAGHPNVGTAYTLACEQEARGGVQVDRLVFEEAAGLVPLTILREGGIIRGAELRAPEALSVGATLSVEAAAACLMLECADITLATHPPQVLSVGLPFLVVELASREALRRARGDLRSHEALLPAVGVDAVYAYCRDVLQPFIDGSAVLHARTFSPLDGVPEDPATGSAMAAMIARRAGLDAVCEGELRWQLHQGVDMGRPSLLLGRTVCAPGKRPTEVYVGGYCARLMAGTFWLKGAAG